MSYQNSIEADRPTVYKTFDDATNKSHPLVAGLGNAAVVTTTPFTHTFDEWTYGPFTLEVWFKPLSTSKITVIGHDDDGIIYDGSAKTISFTVKQVDGTLVTTTQPAPTKVMYLVAQYTGYSAVLMVNGVQSDADVSLPLQTTGTLKSGGGRMSIDALAAYRYLLSDSQMYSHYLLGTDFPVSRDVYSDAENYFTLTDDREQVLLNVKFPDWRNGYLNGVTFDNDGNLINQNGGTDGQWLASLILPDDVPLYSGKIYYEYDGSAPVVEVSLDGTAWQQVTNQSFPLIPVGSPLTDADPLIRVTFASDTILRSLSALIYSDNLSRSNKENRFVELTRPAVSAYEETFVFEQDDNAGVHVNGSKVAVTADTDDGSTTIGALSFWYLGSEPTGGSKNGGSGHVDGQWNFCLKTFADNTAAQTIVTNYDGQIANVATWTNQPNSASLYASHFAKPTILVTESDNLSFTEPTSDVKLYQNNWYML
jgi:hypothetical protein